MRCARLVRLLVLMTTACAVTVPLYAQVPPAPTFTDDPLQPGVTPIKVAHLTELRGAIDSLRARYGVPAMTWTDATLSPGVTPARAVHLTELRTALGDVYAAALRTPPVYTNSPPSAGVTVVTAAHIAELRAGVLAIWDLGPPAVTSISPTVGSTTGGTTVTILGTNFVNPSVLIGGVAATSVVPVDAGTITAVAGPHAVGVVDVVVTNRDGQAALGHFTYHAPPAVTGVNPATGPTTGGTHVYVSGSNFVPGQTTVRIGGSLATGAAWSGTDVTREVITGSIASGGVYDVVVTNPDGLSATLPAAFTYTEPALAITGISPASGPTAGGTSVTITGTMFATGASVTFGGTAADSVNVVNATSIVAVTRAHAAGLVDVVVTNPNLQAATMPGGFRYQLPSTGYLAFGDSITYGLVTAQAIYYEDTQMYQLVLANPPNPSPYPQTLAGLLSKAVDNAGIPGESAMANPDPNVDGGEERLPKVMTPAHGTVIILEGTNDANTMSSSDDDATRQAKAQAIASSLRNMVDQARQQGKRVVLATLPPSVPVQFTAPPYPQGDIYHGPFPWAVTMVNSAIRSAIADLVGDPTFILVDLYGAFGGDSPNSALLSADGLHPSVAGHNAIANAIYSVLPASWR
jgi:lysophospholipase L1-like esterase